MPISVQNFTTGYASEIILDAISFDIAKGESVALIGHNGSGKSTLLKSLIKLIPYSGGEVMFLDQNLNSLSAKSLRELRSKTGFVFQQHNLCSRLSVLTNVIHGRLGKGGSFFGLANWFQNIAPQKTRLKAFEKLDSVGLIHLAGKRANQLSGGQSQRIAIARALMQEPEVIFADEPVASLDPQAGIEVMELLYKLCKEQGITLVFTTHALEHAEKFSDRVMALKNKKIEFLKKTKEIDFNSLSPLYE